jgi:hypothetical protein
LIGVKQGVCQFLTHHLAQLSEQFVGVLFLLIQRQAHPQTKLGVIFKERVRPGRAASLGVDAPGRCRQVAAIDGRAAGSVGDDHAITE